MLNRKICHATTYIWPFDEAVNEKYHKNPHMEKYEKTVIEGKPAPDDFLKSPDTKIPTIFHIRPLTAQQYDLAKSMGNSLMKEKLIVKYGVTGWENYSVEGKKFLSELEQTDLGHGLTDDCLDEIGFFTALRELLAKMILEITTTS